MGRLLRRRSTDATSILEEGGAHLARHRLRNVDEPIALMERPRPLRGSWAFSGCRRLSKRTERAAVRAVITDDLIFAGRNRIIIIRRELPLGDHVKVVQELMRYATISTTMEVYAQAGMDQKRVAQRKAVDLLLGRKPRKGFQQGCRNGMFPY